MYSFAVAIYFNFCLFLVGFSCLMAVVVLTVYYQPTAVMHRYVYKVFLKILARVTFVYVPPIGADQNKEDNVTNEDRTGVSMQGKFYSTNTALADPELFLVWS